MAHRPKSFTHLLGIQGFSDELLKNHFSLYEGYVKNANTLTDKLTALIKAEKGATPEFSEIKRRLGFEYNGIRLHEDYFGNMTKNSGSAAQSPAWIQKITKDYGSHKRWEEDFKAVGAMRGIGWAVAVYEPLTDAVLNVWITEHHVGHIAGATPLLVMDLWEHAMLLDYGTKRADYVEAFFRVIDWAKVLERLNAARR